MTPGKKRKYALVVGSVWLIVAGYHVFSLLFTPVLKVHVTERYRSGKTGMRLKFKLPNGSERTVYEHPVSPAVKPGTLLAVQKSPLFDSYHRRHWYSAFRYIFFFGIAGVIVWALMVLPRKRK